MKIVVCDDREDASKTVKFIQTRSNLVICQDDF